MTQRTEELKNEMEEDKRASFKILDKLEQRISKLEKVYGSHAKIIGQLREDKKDDWLQFNFIH